MARRVWEYNVVTNYLTGCPVYSVIIYLVKSKSGKIGESFYKEEIADQVCLLSFRSIKLWEVPARMLRAYPIYYPKLLKLGDEMGYSDRLLSKRV